MGDLGTAATLIAAVLGVLGVLWRIGRAIWSAGGDARQLAGAMRANTAAIDRLSAEFAAHTKATSEKLSGLHDRVTRLEQRKAG